MIEDEVYSVFISLVLKPALFCCLHIDIIQQIQQTVDKHWAKATEKPAYPPGLKPQRLAAGSSMSRSP